MIAFAASMMLVTFATTNNHDGEADSINDHVTKCQHPARIQKHAESQIGRKSLVCIMSNMLSQAHNLVHRLELIARNAVLMCSSNMTEQL